MTPEFEFAPVTETDFAQLLALRIVVMRESLERIGRFDAERAAQRFRSTFRPDDTRLIRVGDATAGCVAWWPEGDAVRIEHFYLAPAFQRCGLGTAVLRQVFTEAGATPTSGTRFCVAALRDSDANRFFIRHGFVLWSQGEWDIEYQRKYQRGCERAPLALPSTDEPEGLPPR